MEGVEDIPGTALAEGIRWEWESFPEYLDAIERMPRAIDVAAQVPHGAVRAYVMGERGAKNQPPTAQDIERMAEIVREALAAGALGFSTSRTLLHRAIDGEPVPGTFAGEEELLGIGRALGQVGHGVFEMASDLAPEGSEFAWMEKLGTLTGRPITFACLQNDLDPNQWQRLLRLVEASNARGARLVPQVAARPTGLLLGLESSFHPFSHHPSFAEIAALPLADRVRRMRDPAFRARILAESPRNDLPIAAYIAASFHKLFPLGDPPDYEPAPEKSVAAVAAREGRPAQEIAYDLLLAREGKELLYFPLLGYAQQNFDALHTMLTHPQAVLGLSDGGAHCGIICDASMPTFLLTHWVRDRVRGQRLSLEQAVRLQTHNTAALFGFADRGTLTPGLRADVNLIDLENLQLAPPEVVFDLPAQGRRMVQRVAGYRMTIQSGQPIFEDGEPTGALPGRLLRGPQAAPA
jgi:N-acyl-D-aspartate/D-glutamate deacylase